MAIRNWLDYLLYRDDDKAFSKFAQGDKAMAEEKSDSKILVDFSHALYKKWNFKNLLIIKSRKHRKVTEAHAFYPSKLFIWFSFKMWVLHIIKKGYNKDKKICKDSGCSKVVSVSFCGAGFKDSLIEAARVKRNIKSKEDLLALHAHGIYIGDLVYDTYLKWFKKETVNLNGYGLTYVLFFCFLYVRRIDALLKTGEYNEVYLTHSVYVGFGVPARLSLKYGINVYITQNTRNSFVRKLNKEHLHQTPNFECYANFYNSMEEDKKKDMLLVADQKIKSRLSGKIDSSIYYMKSSSYSEDKSTHIELFDAFPGRPWVLIMLHCFFDSPHIYKWMLFPDFSEWLDSTLKFCHENKINVAVKRHPNGLAGNERVVQKYEKRFPFANFLSSKVNNKALAESGLFSCLLTVYGTVAHEFSYLGVPVINAGDNPHVAFAFSKTPRTIEEYRNAILDVTSGKAWKIDKDEIRGFYYINYIKEGVGKAKIFEGQIESKYNNTEPYKNIISSLDEKIYEEMLVEASSCIDGA